MVKKMALQYLKSEPKPIIQKSADHPLIYSKKEELRNL